MSQDFSDMFDWYLRHNPHAYEDWKGENMGNIRILQKQAREFTHRLIEEHKEYARLEEEVTLTMIRRSVRNEENRVWARRKQRELEEDYSWEYHKTSKALLRIFAHLLASLLQGAELLRLEEPHEYREARESYKAWMNTIHSGAEASPIPDTIEDNSPYGKRKPHK